MSRAGVGLVIEKLLTDEDLRIRFAVDRMEIPARLRSVTTNSTCSAGRMLVCGS